MTSDVVGAGQLRKRRSRHGIRISRVALLAQRRYMVDIHTQTGHHFTPISDRIASAIESANVCTVAGFSPSTITRTLASVPE